MHNVNLKSIQLLTQQKELEYTSNTKALNLHNEEITFQLESLTTKYDNLQTQIKVRIILKLKKELSRSTNQNLSHKF